MDSTKTLLGRAFRVLCLEWAAAAPDAAAADRAARPHRAADLARRRRGADRRGGDRRGRSPPLRAPRRRRPPLPAALRRRRGVRPGTRRTAADRAPPGVARRGRAAHARGRSPCATTSRRAGSPPASRGGDRWRRAIALARPRADDAFEKRLAAAGIAGPAGLVELATRLAHDAGVRRPCVTWRGGRLEFSLTDFADSMRWLLQWIVRYRDYDAREVLVVGDDFGPDNGAGGAARRLMIPELHGASFASVGAGADGGRAAGAAPGRRPGRRPRASRRADRAARGPRARELPVAEHRPRLAVPGRGLRPLPRA